MISTSEGSGKSLVFHFGLTLLLVTSLQAQHNECSTVLGHVYDKTDRSGSYLGSDSFESFFCDKTYSNFAEAHDAGVGLKVPIDDLPVSINGHSRDNDWQSYQHEVCSAVRKQSHVESQWKEAILHINAYVISAWKDCILSNKDGLYFWAEVNDDSKSVIFHAKYIGGPSDHDATTALKSDPIQWRPSKSLQDCDSPFPRELGKSERVMVCQRAGNGAMTARLRTSDVGDMIAKIPPLPPIVPPALTEKVVPYIPPCILADRFQQYRVTKGDTVSVRAGTNQICGAQGPTIDGGLTRGGPDGAIYQGRPYYSGAALAPSLQLGTLLGAFTDKDMTSTDTQEAWKIVQSAGPTKVGTTFDQVASNDGFFYLIINDIPNASGDNAQGFTIEVRINGIKAGPTRQ